MTQFGLIGKSLGHSFSKIYFEKKFRTLQRHDLSYELFELPEIGAFPELLSRHGQLGGLNVTTPYKESVIPFLDELSPEAQEIGAVNCIAIHQGRLTGHNTDVYGFSQSIKPFLDANHQRALILGTGGAGKAVARALKKTGVDVYFVTSSKDKKHPNTLFYSEINAHVMAAFRLIVQASPVGTYPDTEACPPLPYHLFSPTHLAYDLIYNPEETLFLKQARAQGAITVNGLSMLHLQADKSWEIWTGN